jgi:hypothetical protein
LNDLNDESDICYAELDLLPIFLQQNDDDDDEDNGPIL